jgi:hypothetical protein
MQKEETRRISVAVLSAAISLVLVLCSITLPLQSVRNRAYAATGATNSGVQTLHEGTVYTCVLDGSTASTISYALERGTTKDYEQPLLAIAVTIDDVSTKLAGSWMKYYNCQNSDDSTVVQVLSTSANHKLIYVSACGVNGQCYSAKLYTYNSAAKQLKYFANLYTATPKFGDYAGFCRISKVKNNKITATWDYGEFQSIGDTRYEIAYKVLANKLSKPTTAKVIKTSYKKSCKLKANKTFKIYKKAGGKQIRMTVKKGKIVKIVALKKVKGKTYIGVRCNGHNGWYKESARYHTHTDWMFKGVYQAG